MGKRKRTGQATFESKTRSKFEDRTGSQLESACDLVLCEDPETGEVIVRPRGKCPEGYIERIASKLEAQDKLKFKVPKKIIIEEE